MTASLRLCCCVVWAWAAFAATGWASESAASKLKDAEALFASGDFESASRGVNDLLIQDQGLSAELRGRLYLAKARLETAFNHGSEIRLWLAKAYEASPGLALDPVKDPPQLIAIWNDLKQTKSPTVAAAPQATSGTGVFAVGLLPLGIGHFDAGRAKDGLLFATSEALFMLASTTVTDDRREQYLLGGLSFVGIYGYELYDMLPSLIATHPEAAEKLRFSLSLFPFGVAQAKNGDSVKAFTLAALQSVLVTLGVTSEEPGQRKVAWGLFAAGWTYGILDGLSNHTDKSATAFRFDVLPMAHAGKGAALFVSTLTFD